MDRKEFPAGKTRGHGVQLLKKFLPERRPSKYNGLAKQLPQRGILIIPAKLVLKIGMGLLHFPFFLFPNRNF